MKIIDLPISEIIPYENNPRSNDGAVDAVAASIREFGFKVPVIVDKNNILVAGHTRLKAAKKLGFSKVPAIRADDLTEEQIKAFRIADNKTAELAEWDFSKLEAELSEIEMDMEQFGFLPEEAALTTEDVDEDEAPEPPEVPKAMPGEIYKLGRHRLMCGDSTNPEDMARLMNGERAAMVFTDPPYGVAIGSKNKMLNIADKGGHCQTDIENDAIDEDELYKILVKAMTNLREIACADDCAYYVSSPQGGSVGLMMMMMMKDAGLTVRHLLVWVKNIATFSMGHLDYDYRHEPIMYTWTKKHNFYGKNQNTVIDQTIDLESLPYDELLSLTKSLLHPSQDSVFYENKPSKSELHPTMKPVKLITRFILNSSKTGDIVADIFGGSGTTLIACEQTGRICRMMEKDPKYIDVIIKRWEDLTGGKVEKVS